MYIVPLFKALAARPYQSAWFLLGASGLGKTSIAFAFAEQIAAELHHIPSQLCTVDNIHDTAYRCHYVPLNGGFHVVVVDEADRMSGLAQLAFLSLLDSIPPKTIFFFTANSTRGFEEPFLSRCRILIFETESFAKDLPKYLAKVYKSEARCSLPVTICEKIAAESNFNVRDALMQLELEIMLARAA
jgi:replication-associated recombination protein RarA